MNHLAQPVQDLLTSHSELRDSLIVIAGTCELLFPFILSLQFTIATADQSPRWEITTRRKRYSSRYRESPQRCSRIRNEVHRGQSASSSHLVCINQLTCVGITRLYSLHQGCETIYRLEMRFGFGAYRVLALNPFSWPFKSSSLLYLLELFWFESARVTLYISYLYYARCKVQ